MTDLEAALAAGAKPAEETDLDRALRAGAQPVPGSGHPTDPLVGKVFEKRTPVILRPPTNMRPPSESMSDEQLGIGAAPAPVSTGEAVTRGLGQGANLGFGPVVEAGVTTALSKVPGVREVAAQLPGMSPDVANPNLTFDQRRQTAYDRLQGARAQHPLATATGEAVGSLAPAALAPANALAAPVMSGVGAAGEAMSSGAKPAEVAKQAAVGVALGMIPGTVVAGVQKIAAGAPGRVASKILEDIHQGEETAVRGKVAGKLEKAAGEDGKVLDETLSRQPELQAVLYHTAKTHPHVAAGATRKVLDGLNGELTPMFQQMEQHAATLPPSAQATVPQLLDEFDKLAKVNKGDIDKNKAIRAARQAIVDEFGPNATITPMELRNLKQSIGRAAFAGDPLAPVTVQNQVKRDLYGPISDHLNRIAEMTPGVDAGRFAVVNKDLSTLIPVSDALEQRVAKEGKAKGLTDITHKVLERGKKVVEGALIPGMAAAGVHHFGGENALLMGGAALGSYGALRAGQAASRAVDLHLMNIAKTAAAMGPGRVPVSMLQDAIQAGVPAAAAIRAARGEMPELPLPQMLGRETTPAERAFSPALSASLQENDPVSGHAALAHEVFGQ